MKTTTINPFNSSDKTQRVKVSTLKASQSTAKAVTPNTVVKNYTPARTVSEVVNNPNRAMVPVPTRTTPEVKAAPVATSNKPSDLEMEIARLTAENERLKKAASSQPKGLTLKVSAKGAMSIYGFGKWPVTLYKSQFEKLVANWEGINAWYEANKSLLREKDSASEE